jgi:hypothetical protein
MASKDRSSEPSGSDLANGASQTSAARVALVGMAAALPAAILGALLAKFFDLSIREVEKLASLTLLVYGGLLLFRWCIHVRLGYLCYRGKPDPEWGARQRWRLSRLTALDGALVVLLLLVGWWFFRQPGHLLQGAITSLMAVAIWLEIEATRHLLEVGGPPCGADVIESCKPFRMLLDPRRIWNGKWGFDSLWSLVTAKIPVGQRSKVAAVLIFGLATAAATQAGAVIARRVSDESRSIVVSAGQKKTPTTTKKKKTPATAPVAEQRGPRTYVDNCGSEVTPGDGIPAPLSAEMKQAWEEASPADGCAQRAQPNQSGTVFVVPGLCRGRAWSLGIASSEYGAAVLLENAASAARTVAGEVDLYGASARVDVANGDFQLLYTAAGPYLLIRSQKTDGNGALQSAPVDCAEIEPGKETYEVLTPGMAELLLRFDRGVEPAWPASVDRGSEGGFDLVSAAGGEVVARAFCVSGAECALRYRGVELTSVPGDVEEVTVSAFETVFGA